MDKLTSVATELESLKLSLNIRKLRIEKQGKHQLVRRRL